MQAHWTSKLDDIARRQLPFALAQALNLTAKAAAVEARASAAVRLNVRKKGLLNIFIRAPAEQRATKTKLSARVMVGGPKTDPERGSILAQQEATGTKRPFRGNLVAIPSREISSKVGGKRVVKPGFELKNFKPFSTPIDGANATAHGARGSRIEGRKNTYVVFQRGTGLPILLQRYGRGKKQTRALWLWVRQSGLTPKLGFGRAVIKTVRGTLDKEIGAQLTKAIASAKAVTTGGGVASSRLPQP